MFLIDIHFSYARIRNAIPYKIKYSKKNNEAARDDVKRTRRAQISISPACAKLFFFAPHIFLPTYYTALTEAKHITNDALFALFPCLSACMYILRLHVSRDRRVASNPRDHQPLCRLYSSAKFARRRAFSAQPASNA